jgi:formate dehydrogenase subunit gamma
LVQAFAVCHNYTMAKTTVLKYIAPKVDPALSISARYTNKPDQLIEILHDLQHEVGYVPETSLPVIAKALNLSRAEVYGVVTFYHDFHMKKPQKHVIKICAAEACQSMGGRALIAMAEKLTKDKKVALVKTYCLGLCASSPAMMVNEKPVARVDAKKLKATIGALT